ncbi:M4 family metallopeptidase [Kribbella sp. NPDC000426]|uniref:M4 family metallopeptidase n=1 Tax=Kribbella sp. NPDC000426 TaxID=3154255 RepID=UPI00332675E5
MAIDSANGLNSFSLHAADESSAGAIEELAAERSAYPGLRPLGADRESDLDPETAARRFLDQAVASTAVPSLTAPEDNGTVAQFKTIGTETVPLTETRTVKFRQMFHDIPVYGSLVTVELDDTNSLVGIDAALGEPKNVDPVASVSPADVLRAAAAAQDGYRPNLTGVVPRQNYYYDVKIARWRLVYILEDVPVRLDQAADDTSPEPPRFVDYVVDAHDGQIVTILPRTPSMATEEQTAADSFGAARTFTVTSKPGGFVLIDPVHNVETYDFHFADPVVARDQLPGDIVDDSPPWTPAAVSAHANAVVVSEFLRTALRRDNIDGRGGTMKSSVNCIVQPTRPGRPDDWVNAFWNDEQMVYGQVRHPSDLRSLAANIDVVAHEMFHGVTDRTARIEYAFQSGALNESISDIFGTVVANLGNPDPRTWNWELGENLKLGNEPFRDLSNPPRFRQPDHMKNYQDLPYTREGDWGGVHINSGIHNKAAFNMFTALDDAGDLILAPAEVAAVFYLALTQRLSRTSQFTDSRRFTLSSARSLFRRLPASERLSKIAAVEAAFEAVGIA